MDVKLPQISRTGCLAEEKKNGANYEEAMNEAFKDIFTNLKEIEKDTGRMRRLRADLERRRSSAPATVLRDQLKVFRRPKQAERQLSTPSLTRTTWSKEVMKCPPGYHINLVQGRETNHLNYRLRHFRGDQDFCRPRGGFWLVLKRTGYEQ